MAEGDHVVEISEEDQGLGSRAPEERCGHTVVRLKELIVLLGGYICNQRTFQGVMFYSEEYLPNNKIWLYNVRLDFWKCVYTKSSEYPRGTSGASAAAIGNDIYMQGGHTDKGNSNAVWKLSNCAGEGVWKEIKIGNQLNAPSPRDKHTCWEFDDKLWQFGGFGPPMGAYLNEYGDFLSDGQSVPLKGWNNQLHVFDPAREEWTNVEGRGRVPSPRAAHAVTKLGSKVYLYGGRSGSIRLDDCYCLDMLTLQWTALVSNGPEKPIGRSWHSFNALNDEEIVLHAGYTTEGQILNDTWILHVPTMTWSAYSVKTDHTRLWHTGASGDNSVVIFGGCSTDIHDNTIPQQMCNDLFIVTRQPESLLKLSLFCVYRHKHSNFHEWTDLPRELYNDLVCLHRNDRRRACSVVDDGVFTGARTACTVS